MPLHSSLTRFFSRLLAFAVLLPCSSRAAEPAAVGQRTDFDAGWRFQKGDPADAGDALAYAKIKDAVIASSAAFLTKSGPIPAAEVPADLGKEVAYTQAGFDDGSWRKLDLPHDWAVEGPFDQKLPGETGKLPWQGVGWYRKHFAAPPAAPGRHTFLDVDGAMSYAAVWCNGRFVGGWPYGYASFRLDLTPFLDPAGDNVLAVRLDNPPASSRWYPGAGIYRHVWLAQSDALHVAHWGTAVRTPEVTAQSATVTVDVTLENLGPAARADVSTAIFAADAQGRPVGQPLAVASALAVEVAGNSRLPVPAKASLPDPKLWDLDHPNLYVAVTTVTQADRPVDRLATVFGVRTVRFDPDQGFMLNGKRVPLQGVCEHHDLGALGTAVNETALRRQVTILKEMGCNAIRTSHNPPTPELLDICDRLGLVVLDESFDCWKKGKNRNDYHLLWDDWHEKDQRALVRRDRNHPCVVLWSVGNEVPDQSSKEGPTIAAELTGIVHDEDGGDALSRRTTAACSDQRAGYNGVQKGLDVMGFNYKPDEYPKFHAFSPSQAVLSTESSSCISSRGYFVFPVTDDKDGGKADFQMSDYSLYAPRWATPPDQEFRGQDKAAPYTAGEFVWTGFDYLGEPTPYSGDSTNLLNFTDPAEQARMEQELKEMGKLRVPSRSSYFGIVDLAGFRKERYYLYQARWRAELPMAHITPHWTWPERVGQVTPVHVATSGDEAELFLNGQSLGRKQRGPLEYRLRWDDVTYAPGVLKVVAYKNGKPWATDEVKTAGNSAKLVLKAEADAMPADGKTLAYVQVSITDAEGLLSPRAGNVVRFSVSGPAEIVATDNGDATDLQSFQSHDKHAFNGKVLLILRPKMGERGAVTVRAESDGLQSGEVRIQAD